MKERERLADEERRIAAKARADIDAAQRAAAEATAKSKAEAEVAQRLAAETSAKSKADIEAAKKLATDEIAKAKVTAEASARALVEAERRAGAEALERARAESAAQVRAELQAEHQRAVGVAERAKAETEAARKQAAEARAEAEATKKAATEATEKARADAEAREALARQEAKKASEADYAVRLKAAEQAAKEANEKSQSERAAHEAELAAQRVALEKDAADRENAERAKSFDATTKLQKQVEELNRKVQQQTAQQLGEGAELDLFEELKKEFPADIVVRINKGAAGADIRHQVRHNGQTCGTILYDSKNRAQWRYEYAEKLRTDQLSDGADHAVLSTNVFPAGEKQLCVNGGVILACPARVLVIADLLRNQILHVHTLRLSAEERAKKTAQLYDYMTSERSVNLFARMASLTQQEEDLMAKEIKAHEEGWKKRGETNRQLQKTHGTLQLEIERIIGTAPGAES